MNLKNLPARFQQYVVVQPNGCWRWKGGRFKGRPQYVTESGERTAAFQFAWEQEHGPMPPDQGLYVACSGIACANPDHRVLLKQGLGRTASRSRVSAARRKREARERLMAEAVRLGIPPNETKPTE
jgi:hypothetical protein